MATPETEIRKLQPIELCTLAQILNQSDAWKALMAIIPKPEDQNQYLFNNDHFKMIEQAIRQQQRSGAEIFLSEWSTLSKRRPTCNTMLDLLVKAELFRAADYLAIEVLKGSAPERPKFGPAAAVDVSDKAFEEMLKRQAVIVGNNSDSSVQPSQEPMTWSIRYEENPVNVTGPTCQSHKAENEEKPLSDLIKFSNSGESDLIKFSDSEIDQDENIVVKKQTDMSENYVLQEAKTEDIPLCVRENAFQASDRITSKNIQDSATTTTLDSTDVSESIIASEDVNLPCVSQTIIPVVVMEFNEKDKNEKN